MKEKVLTFLKNRPDGFSFKEKTIYEKECVLITPIDMKTEWTSENDIFRSCLCDKKSGKIYSLGFKKFTNYGEKPNFQPWNDEWKFEARHKLDGSLLCISKIDGNILCRTRGVFDASYHETGDEISIFYKKYSKLFDNKYINSERYTILCEHTTPKRIIVLREHNEPTLTLLGIISNENAEYENQEHLDYLGQLWEVPRPKRYEYNSISECIADVSAWEGKEGVVIHSPDHQTMKKIKASLYCELHKIATGMNSTKAVLDVFMESPKFAKYSDFYEFIENSLDYEIAEKCKEDIRNITVAYSKVVCDLEKVKDYVNQVREGFTRKEQAMNFQQHWTDYRLTAAFQLLDNNEVDDKIIRKGIEKYLEL